MINGDTGNSKSCILLDVPEAFARCVLAEWIRIEHLAGLDAAVCNRELREVFLGIAYGGNSIYSLEQQKQSTPFLRWCSERGARVDGIRTCVSYDKDGGPEFYEMIFSKLGANVQWVVEGGTNIQWVVEGSSGDRGCLFVLSNVAKWCPNVVEVNLRFYGLREAVEVWDKHMLAFTRTCPQLTILTLADVECSSDGFGEALARCSRLQKLTLCTTRAVPLKIAIPTLTYLNLRSSEATDAVLCAIGANCPSLHTLHMFCRPGQGVNPPVTDRGLRAVIHGCPLLRDVDIEGATGISDEVCVELFSRRNPTELLVHLWAAPTDRLIQQLLMVSPSLTQLTFVRAHWFSDHTLAVCAQHCPLLEILEIGASAFITAEGLVQLFKPGNRLHTISLDSFIGQRDAVLAAITQYCPLLHTVSLSTCPNMSSSAVVNLISHLGSTLRSIELRYGYHMGDEVVLAVAEHCPLLEELRCANLRLTDPSVVRLARSCPLLRVLHVDGTDLGDVAMFAVIDHCPHLEQLCCPRLTTMRTVQALIQRCPQLKDLSLPYTFMDENFYMLRKRGVSVNTDGDM
jgi:hypothetical protein